ncbi:MAG: phosphopantothenoylcysteine decarboxylase [Verrucomicrobiota bacterium]
MNASPIRCLITAGPTREFFDPVRFISNPSSGKMGFAMAEAAREAGWQVTLISGPVALPKPEGVDYVPVVTGEEMYEAVKRHFPRCHLLIKSAAVCDMRPKHCLSKKVKKIDLSMTVEFEPVIDILKTIARTKQQHQTVVGFAAETQEVEAYARKKLEAKNLDWIAANQVGGETSAFESDQNTVTVLGKDGQREVFGPADKAVIACNIVAYLAKVIHA